MGYWWRSAHVVLQLSHFADDLYTLLPQALPPAPVESLIRGNLALCGARWTQYKWETSLA